MSRHSRVSAVCKERWGIPRLNLLCQILSTVKAKLVTYSFILITKLLSSFAPKFCLSSIKERPHMRTYAENDVGTNSFALTAISLRCRTSHAIWRLSKHVFNYTRNTNDMEFTSIISLHGALVFLHYYDFRGTTSRILRLFSPVKWDLWTNDGKWKKKSVLNYRGVSVNRREFFFN